MIRWAGAELALGPAQSFALVSATATELPASQNWGVDLKLAQGSGFLDFTMGQVGKPLAVMVDGEALTVLMLRTSIADQIRLAGDWTQAEAEVIARKLSAQRGTARERVSVRGSDVANTGKPTMELAVVLQEGEEFYDNPWMTKEHRGKELHFGPGVSFEVKSAFPAQDRDGKIAIGYIVVDEAGYRAFTKKATNRQVGIFVGGELMSAATVAGEIAGQGILTGGFDGFTPEEAERLIKYLRGEG